MKYVCGICGKVFSDGGYECSNGQIACSYEHFKAIESLIKGSNKTEV